MLRFMRIILPTLAVILLLVGSANADCPLGDLSRDCEVDFDDIRLYAEQWLDETDCFDPDTVDPNCADIDGIDGVNMIDYAHLTRNWGQAGHPIMINEFMASNNDFVLDPQGEDDDWLELYNAGNEPCDVGGMYLTNNITDPMKWKIPDDKPTLTTIPSHGHLWIWADKDYGDSPGLHADFKIDADGGEIALFHTNGTTLIDSVAFDRQATNISYGRYTDGTVNWRYLALPTPEGINDGAYKGLVENPLFSKKRGFYDDGFMLTIACDTENALIYYTTDGTEPGISDGRYYSGTRYNNPFLINSTTCLQAKAVRGGWKPSELKAQTYIFDADDATKSLPIISLVGDDEKTFYEPDGIMAIVGGNYSGGVWTSGGPGTYNNIMQHGMAYERPVSFEFFNAGAGRSDFQVNCGVRVHGSDWMRPRYKRCGGNLPIGWTGDCKIAFRLYFRSRYGQNRLEYPLFPYGLDKFESIVLRSGHNDRTNPFIIDELARRLHLDMGNAASTGTNANVFVNGEYKGYYNPCEHIKDSFLQEFYNSDEEWDVMTMSGIRDGDSASWNEMINYARSNDLTNPIHYWEVATRLDIQAFVDYLILQLWCANWDWPQNNWSAAGERSDEGRWKFFIWDAEGGFAQLSTVYFDRLNTQNNANGWLYRSLKVSDDFKQTFTDRLFKHFYNEGALTKTNIDSRFAELRDEVTQVVLRRTGSAVNESIINSWVPNRPSIFLNACRSEGMYTYIGPELRINGAEQLGGYASSGDTLTIHNPHTFGDIYYTTDGNDPRLPNAGWTPGTTTNLVVEASVKRVTVPTGPVNDWNTLSYDHSSWQTLPRGTVGVGYETRPGDGTNYVDLFDYDVESEMHNIRTTCYIRIPFSITTLDFTALTLNIRYDDGFVAYINGQRVTSRNFNDDPTWDSQADSGHSDQLSVSFETIDLSNYLYTLRTGDNILAIQALNVNAGSSDFLNSAKLDAYKAVINQSGTISPSAIKYTGGWILTKSTEVKARMLSGQTWTALTEATFAVGPVAENLRITEIMYHPQDTNDPMDPNEEFIELQNIGSTTINLNQVRFTNGIDFTFGDIELAPGEYLLIVRNRAAFYPAHPGFTGIIAGEYSGRLDDAGEKIELQDAAGKTFLDFKYDDDWREVTDGKGHSLTIIDPAKVAMLGPDSGLEAHWKFDDGAGMYATDSAGDNDGLVLGSRTWTTGTIGGALQFVNLNDYVSLGANDALTTDNVTVATWVRPGVLTGSWNPVIVQHKPAGNGYYLYLVEDKPAFSLASASDSSAAMSAETLAMDEWNHIAATNNGSNLRIYIDGRLAGSDSSLGRTGASYTARIGYDGASAQYIGIIDDMRIYDRALSGHEVGQLIDPLLHWGDKDSWRASAYIGGSPGWDDSGILPNPGAIVINEIMAHSHAEAPDWIELYNTTDAQIDIGGWYCSDSETDLMKYRFPVGTKIEAYDYLIINEDDNFGEFSTDPGKITGFAFSENGDEAYISSGQPAGLTGYRVVEDFGASPTGVSFGRYSKTSTDNYNFVAMDHNTPDDRNAYPAVGPIVINEIMYNPDWPPSANYTNNQYEYIELHNITDQPIILYDQDEKEPWMFTDGIEFTFPPKPGLQLPAGGYIVVAKDITAYLARYGMVPFGTFLLGPYDGKLSDGTEKLEISMPGDVDEFGRRQYIRVDRINYSDGSHAKSMPSKADLWPTDADGTGKSLTRIAPELYGNDPNNWTAQPPSPGAANP